MKEKKKYCVCYTLLKCSDCRVVKQLEAPSCLQHIPSLNTLFCVVFKYADSEIFFRHSWRIKGLQVLGRSDGSSHNASCLGYLSTVTERPDHRSK